jgi:hypothetical protein
VRLLPLSVSFRPSHFIDYVQIVHGDFGDFHLDTNRIVIAQYARGASEWLTFESESPEREAT